MSQSITRQVVTGDLYLYRWLMLYTMVVGLAAIFGSGFSDRMRIIGWILLVTAIVAYGVFLVFYGLLATRQTRSVVFVLSLPISPMQYARAKVTAVLIAFLVPWVVLSGTVVGLTLGLERVPDGQVPFVVTIMGLFLANFCLLIAIGLITGSEQWGIVGILATNTSIPIFMSVILPAIGADPAAATMTWSSGTLLVLAIELAVIIGSLALAFYVQSRKRDFI